MGMMGGGGGGKGGGGGSGGVSDFDFAMIQQAVGQNIQALQNRYKQLGLGQPSGDPLTAALGGTSLTYAGPSTMETQDVAQQNQIGQAAQGLVQSQNVDNPFAPGSPANLAELASQNAQLASAAGTAASRFGGFGGNAGGPSTGGNLGGVNLGQTPNNLGGGLQDTGTPSIG
jgi:hypothetical protein